MAKIIALFYFDTYFAPVTESTDSNVFVYGIIIGQPYRKQATALFFCIGTMKILFSIGPSRLELLFTTNCI